MRATHQYGAVIGAEARQALRSWAQTVGLEFSAALRQLVCLGIGLTLDEARAENVRQEIRRQAMAESLVIQLQAQLNGATSVAEQEAICLRFGQAPRQLNQQSGRLDYARVVVHLSPDSAARFVAWSETQGHATRSEALREALQGGMQRTPDFLPGGAFFEV